MKPCKYQIKSGRFAGMWHVRLYHNGKYFHVGRFKSEQEADVAMQNHYAAIN